MSKFFKRWIRKPMELVMLVGIVYFIAVAVKEVYFVPWYKFW